MVDESLSAVTNCFGKTSFGIPREEVGVERVGIEAQKVAHVEFKRNRFSYCDRTAEEEEQLA